MAGQAIRIVIQYGSLMVLARLLTPEEFGVIAMAAVIVGLADVFRDFGLSAAAVQAKNLSPGQQTQLFWANTGIGALLLAVVWLSAPLAAMAYNDPVVTDVLRGLAWVFLLGGAATQYRARLNRDLRFGALAVTEIIAQAAGAVVAIVLAMNGVGWWSLIWSQISVAGVGLVAMLAVTRWIPGLPRRDVEMRSLFHFGWHMVLSQVIGFIGANIDKFLIGRELGRDASGQYDRAARVINVPLTQLRAPTTSVAIPILSKLQDQPVRYMHFLIRGQVGLGYTLVAAAALASAAAAPLVAITLGSNFERAVPVVQAVSFAGAANTLGYVGYWVFVSRGLTKQLSQWSLVAAIVRTVAVIVGLQWGLLGVAWAAAAVPFVLSPLSLLWLGRLAELDFAPILQGYVRIVGVFFAGSLLGFVAESSIDTHVAVDLALGVGGCVGAYGLALLLPVYRRDLGMLREFVTTIRNRRATSE